MPREPLFHRRRMADAQRDLRAHRAAASGPAADTGRRAGRRQDDHESSRWLPPSPAADNAGSMAPRPARAGCRRRERDTAVGSTRSTPPSRTPLLQQCSRANSTIPLGTACRARCSSSGADAATTSSHAYYAHPTRGTRSASADRPARAAMCAWASTSATPGRRPRPRPATRSDTAREPPCRMMPTA